MISPPTVISPLPAFSINTKSDAFISAVDVNEPPLLAFVIATVEPFIVPPVIFILPLSFTTLICLVAVISPLVLIPFLPRFPIRI